MNVSSTELCVVCVHFQVSSPLLLLPTPTFDFCHSHYSTLLLFKTSPIWGKPKCVLNTRQLCNEKNIRIFPNPFGRALLPLLLSDCTGKYLLLQGLKSFFNSDGNMPKHASLLRKASLQLQAHGWEPCWPPASPHGEPSASLVRS